jgi:hypothetical protein
MATGWIRDLLARELRANPGYELVLYDRLPAAERAALAGLCNDPDFYGVLRPRAGAALGLKSVDRDTALLFLTLAEPGPLPAYARAALGAAAARTLAQLVADGVLEVASGGAFLSGAAALEPAPVAAGAPRPGSGRLAELSRAALRYGQALALDDPLRLAWRLYGYNRRPLTPRWRRLLPGAEAVERHLGIAPGGANRRLLDQGWTRLDAVPGWLSWRAHRAREERVGAAAGATYKLYVSPAPEALAAGFGNVLAALAAARAPQFKVGVDAWGLLRPDKIVAYFPSFERLGEAAGAVAERLGGAPAQGVPFTAEIAADGLLSWGVDPPAGDRGLLWGGRESWRLWLAHRLARALLAARAAASPPVGVEPWHFALERLRLEGVDTDSWTPGALLFREP